MDCNQYPDLFWARLKLFDNGNVEVALQDKTTYGFTDIESAQRFLREDEFTELADLNEDDKREMRFPEGIEIKSSFSAEESFEHFKFIGKY